MPEGGGGGRPAVDARPYGTTRGGEAVQAFTLDGGEGGIRLTVLEYGGIVARLEAPDRHGRRANVVLGRPSLEAYEAENPYLGAIVGRYANRLRDGAFHIDGVEHRVTQNQGPHHLHGGPRGFHARVWRGEPVLDGGTRGLVLRYVSPDGEEGYPGRLRVSATYLLASPAVLRIELEAATDAPTVVNLTTHSYFNLAGEGAETVCDHVLTVDADAFTPVDDALLPLGEIGRVAGTPLDLRAGARVGDVVRADHPQIRRANGVDHNFVLRGGKPSTRSGDRTSGERAREPLHREHAHERLHRERSREPVHREHEREALHRAARLEHAPTGRALEVHTDQPGLQVYTGNALTGELVGTSGRCYRQGDGIALETQNFPDAPNNPAFPSAVLRPGETYRTVTELTFTAEGPG